MFAWGDEQYIAVNGPPLRVLSSSRTIRNMKIQRIFPTVGEAVDLDLAGAMERYVHTFHAPATRHVRYTRAYATFNLCGSNHALRRLIWQVREELGSHSTGSDGKSSRFVPSPL